MEFCQNCSTRLIPDFTLPETQLCPKCGFKKKRERKQAIQYDIRQTPKENIVVIDPKEIEFKVLPTTKAKCPKCENSKAYFRISEIGIEEEETIQVQIFRCTHCGHTWRERG